MNEQKCPQCEFQLERHNAVMLVNHIFLSHEFKYRKCPPGCEESVGFNKGILAHRWDDCYHCNFCGTEYECVKKRLKHELNCSEASQEIRGKVKAIWMKLAHRKARFQMASKYKTGTPNSVLGDRHDGTPRCVSYDTALR